MSWQSGDATLYHGDCLDVMAEMDANSVGLIATDPPYYKVKDEPWDRQWDTPDGFLAWLDKILAQFFRLLKANGSLYVFASPKMAARVECLMAERFHVLNRITWAKPPYSTKAEMFRKDDLRSYFPVSERIIFAEHYGADNAAKGERGWGAKCDELRGFVFEPLRAYLAGERDRAGFSTGDVDSKWQEMRDSKGYMAGHWFGVLQWALPTRENYEWLRDLFNRRNGGDFLRREYEDLRREYEDLRREYEDLRRPFAVTAETPYTDVWGFPTVQAYDGKHPCEKPLEMMRHIVRASSRPGDLVLDPFMGSGTTGVAAKLEGRGFIGVDKSAHWCDVARSRIAEAQTQPRLELA